MVGFPGESWPNLFFHFFMEKPIKRQKFKSKGLPITQRFLHSFVGHSCVLLSFVLRYQTPLVVVGRVGLVFLFRRHDDVPLWIK